MAEVRFSKDREHRFTEPGKCHWCGLPLLTKRQKTWCSFGCQKEAYTASGRFTRQYFLEAHRDAHGGEWVCAECGVTESDADLARDWIKNQDRKNCLIGNYSLEIAALPSPEVDHIVAIALGGHPTDFANLRVLCSACHRKKTAEDLGALAAVRREGREKEWRKTHPQLVNFHPSPPP